MVTAFKDVVVTELEIVLEEGKVPHSFPGPYRMLHVFSLLSS